MAEKFTWGNKAKHCRVMSTNFFKSLLTMPSNILPLHLKETFPPIIWIFTEGDGIRSRLPFKIFSTLTMGQKSLFIKDKFVHCSLQMIPPHLENVMLGLLSILMTSLNFWSTNTLIPNKFALLLSFVLEKIIHFEINE